MRIAKQKAPAGTGAKKKRYIAYANIPIAIYHNFSFGAMK